MKKLLELHRRITLVLRQETDANICSELRVRSIIIGSLAENSRQRIGALRSDLSERLAVLPEAVKSSICIYATGSLARLEANAFSDLDAFFYVLGSSQKNLVQPVWEIKTFNHVIDAAEAAGFPDFYGGGEYLHFQYLADVVENIGSRQDDYINGLTSRMLLILESSYLFNESQFDAARQQIIDRYFKDFHDHSANFRPIFILNDVLRFWRTLCLNYEHSREWKKRDPTERAKGHLKNLKLRFSRMMICYSFVTALLQEGPALSAKRVQLIASKTPIDRMVELADGCTAVRDNVAKALDEYSWFLSAMNKEKEDVLSWIRNKNNRDKAFSRSRKFIENMYEVTWGVAELHGYTRYLVI
jgi:hypothetical protein